MPRFTRMRHHTRLARELRKRPTEAERVLWQRLRYEQLGIAFRRQHPIAGFVVDFYAAPVKLAVELDGGQHAEGLRDAARTEVLLSRGVSVLRFWNSEVLQNADGVCLAIRAVVGRLSVQTPPPAPPLAGEGGADVDLDALSLRLSLAEGVE